MHTLEVTSPIPAVGTSIPDTKAEPGGPHHAARFQSPTPPQIPANPRKHRSTGECVSPMAHSPVACVHGPNATTTLASAALSLRPVRQRC